MNKTSLKKLTSIALAVIMLMSVFAVSAFAADTDANSVGTSTVYFSPGDSSNGNPAWFAWTWGTGSGAWSTGTQDGDYIRFDNIDSNMCIVRMPTGSASADWDSKWDQSEDITVNDNLYIFSAWSETYGGKWTVTESHYSGGGDTPSTPSSDTPITPSSDTPIPAINYGPVVLDASGVDTGFVEWKAWTWTGSNTGHWVSAHGTSAADITFDEVEENIIFAYFEDGTGTPDIVWTGKIGQTTDMTVDGTTFVVTSVGNGEVNGYWEGGGYTEPSSASNPTTPSSGSTPTTPSSQQTIPTASTAPIVTEPSSIVSPTDPTAADEDTSFYVSAKSNINSAGSKVKVTGNDVQVSYTLTAPEKIDDGQVSISYDTNKLTLNPAYNTKDSMFPVITDAAYNLNAATGVVVFNFSGINGKYDFTSGGVLVNLVFQKKTPTTVGTATVYMNVSELSSKDTAYVDDNKIASGSPLTVGQTVADTSAEIPSETDASTSDNNNISVSAKSNLTATAQTVNVTNSNVKVTYNLTAPELIAYGDATVTFDNSKLALENKYNTKETMFTVLSSNVSYRLNVSDGVMKFNFTGVSNDFKGVYDFTSGGAVITLMFTVRAGAESTADVNLAFEQLGSIDTKYIENSVVLDNNATVNITAAGEDATKSSTDPTSDPIASGGGTTETNPIPSSSDSTPTTPSSDSTPTTPSSDSTPTTPSSDSTPTTPSSDSTPTTPSSDSTPTTPSSAAKTSVKAEAAKSKIYVGATTTISTLITNGVGSTTFTSSSKSIATVTSAGKVTAKKAGTVTITVKNNGATAKVKITIVKKANTITVKAKSISAKKAKTMTFKKAKAFTIKKAQGTVTFTKKSGNKKITINKKTGKITVKKGLKKGTYKLKVAVKAKGNTKYNAKTKTVTVKVKVK